MHVSMLHCDQYKLFNKENSTPSLKRHPEITVTVQIHHVIHCYQTYSSLLVIIFIITVNLSYETDIYKDIHGGGGGGVARDQSVYKLR